MKKKNYRSMTVLFTFLLLGLSSAMTLAQEYRVYTTDAGNRHLPGALIDSVKVEGNAINFYAANEVFFTKTRENVEGIGFIQSMAYPEGIPHLPGIVEAEDFDLGGEGIAFHDNDLENQGTPLYRNAAEDNPVGIQATEGAGNGHNVGFTSDGEWLNYTITVPEAGLYDFTFRTTNDHDTSFDLQIDGETVQTVTVPTDWWAWSDVPVPGIQLPAGVHVITIYMNGGFAFDKFEFVKQ
jgi:hypothetical protein